jgi:hypothetical protein
VRWFVVGLSFASGRGAEAMSAPSSQLGRAAQWYAKRHGFKVFPVHCIERSGGCTCFRTDCGSVGKHPKTKHGVLDATTDIPAIEKWWTQWPDANVGLATGDGFFVLDVDPRHGGDDSLLGLELKHGKLPDTVECITGGNGRHIYFAYDNTAAQVDNSVGRVARGVDVRGNNGYVLLPPSNHQSGRRYRWEFSSRIDEVEIAVSPEWLLSLIRDPLPENRTPRPPSEWVQVLRGGIAEGGRNDALARLAGLLLRIRILDPEIAGELVHAINLARCKPPLEFDEVEKIIDSISDRELARAREGRP